MMRCVRVVSPKKSDVCLAVAAVSRQVKGETDKRVKGKKHLPPKNVKGGWSTRVQGRKGYSAELLGDERYIKYKGDDKGLGQEIHWGG